MSQVLEYPQIYSESIEPIKITKDKNVVEKRYFKLFLMNNRKTLPTLNGSDAVTWSIKDIETLDTDIDSFINTPIVDEDEDHHDPSRAGIEEENYGNPYNYVSDVINFHKNYGIAKVLKVYRPDKNLLNAARADSDVIVNYKALGETLDPNEVKDPIRKQKVINFIEKLDRLKAEGKDLYVSPGVYALSDERNGNDVIVKRFVGTHVAVVKNPAHTKPIAFIHKETCKIDGNTCYLKLFNASELVKLNNNNTQNKNMADPSQISTGVEDMDANTDEYGNRIETEVTDPSGNVHKEVSKSETKVTTPESKKKEVEKKIEKKEVEKPKDTKLDDFDSKKSKKDNDDDKDGYIKKSDLDEYFKKKEAELIQKVDQIQEAKLESVRKVNIVNSFISKDAEDLAEEYEFYSNLPVSSEQLSKILKDSKFNTEDKTKSKEKTRTYIASTTDIDGASYANDDSRGSSTVDGEIIYSDLYCGNDIPDRFK